MNANTAQDLLECGHPASPHAEFTTGYGTDSDGKRYCYECCAERDRQDMRETGKAVLYLTHEPFGQTRLANQSYSKHSTMGEVTNWPSSLRLPCRVKRGRHNIAGTRYDVWFTFEGQTWHGVQYGENTQLCVCKQLKKQG